MSLFKKLTILGICSTIVACKPVSDHTLSRLSDSDVSLNAVHSSIFSRVGNNLHAARETVHDAVVAPRQSLFSRPDRVDQTVVVDDVQEVQTVGYKSGDETGTAYPGVYTIDTGDTLRVVVYSQRTLTRDYNVDASGYVSVPLAGRIYARGKTSRTLELEIIKKMKGEVLKDPKVSVEIVNYRPFFILGEVRNAGQFPYIYGMSVQTAVAIAGGHSPRAYKKRYKISRVRNGQRYKLSVSPDSPVYPGDTITVQERRF